ncbi:hypothetical protein SUDANB120_04341 [Streptomyces sp. enrichment culture]|uniref:ArsR/SmtB family transcription factor n=1 Tax=Streptomyces sp. enrichment culture TaxID=1795815 RepID=UPI003F54A6F8
MGFHFRFGAADLLRCRFAVSPRWEVQEAVRTLRRPRRHAHHLPWLRRIRAAAEELDLRPLWLLMPRAGHNPDFLSPPPLGPSAAFEEELARVRTACDADPEAVREDLRRALECTPGAAGSDLGLRMLADPRRAVRELCDLYEQAWEALVAPHWPRLRHLLEADVLFHSRRLAAGGLEALFDGLHPDLAWAEDTATLSIRRPGHHDRSLGGQGLLLMPSAFVWPDVVGGYDPPWQPTLVYPARGIGALWSAPAGPAPQALARLLGRGRAQVLTALEEPAATTELAARLGLAPATVSEHLKALHGAGLLVSARHGHRVLYERTPLGIALATGTPPPA